MRMEFWAGTTAVGPTAYALVRTCQDFASPERTAPLDWLQAFAEISDASLAAAVDALNTLAEQTVVMAQLAVDLFGRYYDSLPESEDEHDRAQRAAALGNLANRLGDLGHREQALSRAEEARHLFSTLAAQRPDAFRPGLAMSLSTLGNRLSRLGRREEALTTAEEAVGIYRDLAARRPDAFRPDLALAVATLSLRQGDLDRDDDALTSIREANNLFRELAGEAPDAFNPRVAQTSFDIARRLGSLGRWPEALPSATEAVSVLAPYFLQHPDAFCGQMKNATDIYALASQETNTQPDQAAAALSDAD